MIKDISIGTDIEEIKRFEGKDRENDSKFLSRIFTEREMEYCYSNKNPAPHLCARFCAKEAVVKALSGFGISDVYYSDIEILKKEDGAPYVSLSKYPDIKVKISVSHCKSYASANAVIIKE